jgi:hypothetical protein
MAIECFAVARAFRAAAHHAAHRLAGHHIHHMRRAVVHHTATLHTTKFPAVVCMVAGLAAVGAGGFVAGSKTLGPAAPGESGGPISTPLFFPASGVDSPRFGVPSSSLIASLPIEVGSSPDTPFSYNWDEAGDLWHTPSTFAWSEISSPLNTWPSRIGDEVGTLQDHPSSSWANESNSTPDTPSQPGAVPEPASTSMLVASLFGAAILSRRERTRAVATARPSLK